jgi:hypothetical protein
MAFGAHSRQRVWVLRSTVLLGATCMMMVLATLTDRFYGRFLMPESVDLVYPAFSRAHHQSAEFSLMVGINNLGFRGPDVSVKKSRKRIMLLGDSFTFGWGVQQDETWADLLQKKFPQVEILNLGKGGTHPGDHVQTARKAIPVLKPDLIIWGILQGNDLGQLIRVMAFERGQEVPSIPQTLPNGSAPNWLSRFSHALLPNMTRRWPKAVNISDRWASEVLSIMAELNSEDSARYMKVAPEIRVAFENGEINPSLIFEALHHPDLYRAAADTSDTRLHEAIVRLSHHFLEMKAMCMAANIELIIVSLPNRPYGCADCISNLVKLGYDVSGCDTLNADLPFDLAVQDAQMGAEALSGTFVPTAACYYPIDGHWNTLGNRIFADSLASRLNTHFKWNSLQTSGNL